MLQRLIRDGFPLTPEVQKAPVFGTDQIVVFRASATIARPTALESAYEFVLAGEEGFQVIIEGRDPVTLEQGCLMPVNPGQVHGAAKNRSVKEYLPVFIGRDFLSDLAYQVWGKGNVCFTNRSRSIPVGTVEVLQAFIEAAAVKDPNRDILACLNYEVTLCLMRGAGLPQLNIPAFTDKKLVKAVESYLRESLSNRVSLDELSRLVNYSPYHLIKIFKHATGRTPMTYLAGVRVERAQQLLRDSELSVSEISELCGYSSLSYFCTSFKRETGYSPSAYRKLL